MASSLARACAPLLSSLALALASLAGCGGGDGDTGGEGGSGGGAPQPKYQPFALPGEAWSHGDPTPLEQDLLEEIQRARLNPTAEVDIVLSVPGVKSAMKQFGTDEAVVRADFMTYSPVPPLSFDANLLSSARRHSEDMAQNGFQDHDSSDGTPFDERIDEAGYDWSYISENVFAYANSVAHCHAAFMIDWGNPEPGHRHAILDVDGQKRDIGIAIVEDPAHKAVGPLVVTQDFGMPMKPPADAARFIVGVAYADENENGSYDPGEGLEGLKIVPERGAYHAITSKSGGFSVPISKEPGVVKVQIQDETDYVLDQKEVELTGENVKLDFVRPAP